METKEQLKEIVSHLTTITEPNHVYEIRALKYRKNPSGQYATKPGTWGAYFVANEKQIETAAKWILKATNEHVPSGIYITINPVMADLLQRRNKPGPAQRTTDDDETLKRTRLLIDIDANRPHKDLMATDTEREKAIELADEVLSYLNESGFPEPYRCSTGNGASLYYAIDLPNDEDSLNLIHKFLETMDKNFSTTGADIDLTVHNAARIARVCGTWNRKGEDIPQDQLPDGADHRPHRLSSIISIPDEITTVSKEQIQGIIEDLSKTAKDKTDPEEQSNDEDDIWLIETYNGKSFKRVSADVQSVTDYLESFGVGVLGTHNRGSDVWLDLDKCPASGMESEHSRDIGVRISSGKIGYKNYHNRGNGITWLDVRDALEPGYKKFAIEQKNKSSSSTDSKQARLPAKYNQVWAAQRFTEIMGNNYHYAPAQNVWYIWNGKNWAKDDLNSFKADIFIKKFIPKLLCDAKGTPEYKYVSLFISSKLGTNSQIDGAIKIIQSHLSIYPDRFDNRIHHLNVQNGIVNLQTGQLEPHDKEAYFSTILDIHYDPEAKCPVWEEAMRRITADENGHERPDLYEFAQKCFGYCITGDITEQVFFIAFGKGRNGKTFTLEYIIDMIEQYGCSAPQSILTTKNPQLATSNHYDEAVLHSKRMALASETREGEYLDTPKVKRLTGNKRIRARNPYGQYFEFPVTHKILVDCNYRPKISEMDEGTWRRIVVLPFDYRLKDKERDFRIDLKWNSEKQGILRWLVDGSVSFYKEGLSDRPECCNSALKEYQEESDYLLEFISECFEETEDDNFISNDVYYKVYKKWAEENGYSKTYTLTKQSLTKKLNERGLECKQHKVDGNKQRGFKGYYLTDQATAYIKPGGNGYNSYRASNARDEELVF